MSDALERAIALPGVHRAQMFCDMKAYNECGCEAGACNMYPEPTAVPVVAAHGGDFLRLFGFAIITTAVAFWALSEAERQYAKIDRDRQEVSHVYSR